MRIKNDIKITFVEARDLLAMDKNFTTSDPYVKIKDVKGLHLPGNDDLYRTKVVKKNLNPKWGESFNLHFDDRLSKLNFLVYDYEVMSRDARIGKVRLNADQLFPTTSGSHAVIDRWLPLKPKGELHVIIEVHWRIPIALPVRWIFCLISCAHQDYEGRQLPHPCCAFVQCRTWYVSCGNTHKCDHYCSTDAN
ncbi:C2 domain-containing protein [Cladochytrium replicatum]|nr:C2 domain-containing protein [Cladochytrium replicatum]